MKATALLGLFEDTLEAEDPESRRHELGERLEARTEELKGEDDEVAA